MTIRIRHRGCPPKDIDMGPAHAQRTPFYAMRREIDDAIVHAAARGHVIGNRAS